MKKEAQLNYGQVFHIGVPRKRTTQSKEESGKSNQNGETKFATTACFKT